MAKDQGIYKSHRECFLKIKKLYDVVHVEGKSINQVLNSANRFMKNESKFKLSCKTSGDKFAVVAIDLIENWKSKT